MIGPYGIIANQDIIERPKRHEALAKMSNDVDQNDFCNKELNGKNYSIGLTYRTIGENKDLSSKAVEKDFVIVFCGYGRFTGEKNLYWAEEMIGRIEPVFREKGKGILSQIEGSFLCLIIYNNEMIMASDRFGSKNLFYYDTKEIFVFAPDVGRILNSGLVPREKNIEAATQVLISGFFLDDSTLVKDIFRFPYASVLSKSIRYPSEAKIKKYWDIPKTVGRIDKITPDSVETFADKMQKAIDELACLKERIIVPLSGGLDSRAIACFVSERQKLNTLTYDLGSEVRLAKKVCEGLNGDFHYFSNAMIRSNYFKQSIKQLIIDQRRHAVLNQYFYAPLFRDYFAKQSDKVAIYDGVYLDILFSAPYTYERSDVDDYINIYGRGIGTTAKFSRSLKNENLYDLMNQKYHAILKDFSDYHGVGNSQLFYLKGRLRRYGNEFLLFKEDFCYVLKPAYNYELMDFGFRLSLRFRKGVLYNQLFEKFPKIAKVPYKDSYGNRNKTLNEKVAAKYLNFRLKLSSITQGILKYSPSQADYFFTKEWNRRI